MFLFIIILYEMMLFVINKNIIIVWFKFTKNK